MPRARTKGTPAVKARRVSSTQKKRKTALKKKGTSPFTTTPEPSPSQLAVLSHPLVQRFRTRSQQIGSGAQLVPPGFKLAGVHDWLKDRLWGHNWMMERPGSGSKKASLDNPLWFGIQFDHAMRQLMAGREPTKFARAARPVAYARAAAAKLMEWRYTVIPKTNNTLCDPLRWRVRTQADLLCLTPEGRLCVVELKTTQMRTSVYKRNYHRPSPTRPWLNHRGLRNTEYNHHQAQLGAMMAMLVDPALYALPPDSVEGLVLLVSVDESKRLTVTCYRAAPWVLDRSLYESVPTPLVPAPLSALDHTGRGLDWIGQMATTVGPIPVLVRKVPRGDALQNMTKTRKRGEIRALFSGTIGYILKSAAVSVREGGKRTSEPPYLWAELARSPDRYHAVLMIEGERGNLVPHWDYFKEA